MKQLFAVLAPAASAQTALRLTWPVHRGSTRAQIRWEAMPRADVYRWYRIARAYNRAERPAGRRGGRLGSAALRVLEALMFDFLSYQSGRLDPAYEQVARVAGLARSTVAEALRRLRSYGVIDWQRRCHGEETEQGFRLVQETNAYVLRPPSKWAGYKPGPDDAPPPPPDLLGCPARVPEVAEAAALLVQSGASLHRVAGELDLAGGGGVEAALAGLARAMEAAAEGPRDPVVVGSDHRIETGSTIKR